MGVGHSMHAALVFQCEIPLEYNLHDIFTCTARASLYSMSKLGTSYNSEQSEYHFLAITKLLMIITEKQKGI